MQTVIPKFVSDKLTANLHLKQNHPIEITKSLIYKFFDDLEINVLKFEKLPKEVSVKDNFDSLLIPRDHPSRKSSDTYYVNTETVLRTHATAHQSELLSKGHRNFLIVGDVYRKDTVDRTHYFVFHQIDGVLQTPKNEEPRKYLEKILGKLIEFLFPGKKYRISDDYFPFTQASLEAEILFGDKWLEILGGGVVHSKILQHHNISEKLVAFGLGLERIAMLLFDIPDIRLFWSSDPKFLDQFSNGEISKFVPFSKVDPITFDISFFIESDEEIINGEWIKLNDFHELVRDEGGDLVESVDNFDKFRHPKKQKLSYAFHIVFSPASSCTNSAKLFKDADDAINKIRATLLDRFQVELR